MNISAKAIVYHLLGISTIIVLLVADVQAAVQGMSEEDVAIKQSEKNKEELPLGTHAGVTVNYRIDDNIYRSETEEIDDTSIALIPTLLYKGEAGRHPYSLNFVGEFARFQDFSTENYDDIYSLAEMTLDLTKKLDLNLKGNYIWSHDARAVPASRLDFDLEPDTWELGRLFAEMVYGRKTNKAQIKAFVEGRWRPYTNNGQETRSRNRITGGATFFYNMRPKTSLLAEISYADIDYYHGATPIDLSSSELDLSLGIKWEATAKTTGQIKLGYLIKNLEDDELDDFGGLSVKASVLWEPKTYSRVKLLIQRRTDESIQVDSSFFVTTRLAASWEHDLTDSLAFALRFDGQNDKYSAERDDDLLDYGLDFNYEINRRLLIGARYVYSLKTSNVEDTDYVANIFMLRVTLKTL